MKNKPNNAYIFCSGFECFLVLRYQNEFYSIELDTFQTDKMTKDDVKYWKSRCRIYYAGEEITNLIINKIKVQAGGNRSRKEGKKC